MPTMQTGNNNASGNKNSTEDTFGSTGNDQVDSTSQVQTDSTDNDTANQSDNPKEDFDKVLAKKMAQDDKTDNSAAADQNQAQNPSTDQPQPAEATGKTDNTNTTVEITAAVDQAIKPNTGSVNNTETGIKIVEIPAENTPAVSDNTVVPLTNNQQTNANQTPHINQIQQPATDAKPQEIPLQGNNTETAVNNTAAQQQTVTGKDTSNTSAEVETTALTSADVEPATLEPETKETTESIIPQNIKQTEVAAESNDQLPKTAKNDKFDKNITNLTENTASGANTESSTAGSPAENVIKTDLTTDDNHQPAAKTEKTQSVTETQTAAQTSADTQTESVSAASVKADTKMQAASSVVNQITQEINASMGAGRDQISIALDPPELGKVTIRFQQTAGEIVGIVEADKAQTRQEIAEEMPAIVRSLEDSGVAVKRVEVVLTEKGDQDALNNSGNEQYNTGREGFTDGQASDDNTNTGSSKQLLGREYQNAGNSENYQNHVSDEAINMYI